jgi:hypothetical protein
MAMVPFLMVRPEAVADATETTWVAVMVPEAIIPKALKSPV